MSSKSDANRILDISAWSVLGRWRTWMRAQHAWSPWGHLALAAKKEADRQMSGSYQEKDTDTRWVKLKILLQSLIKVEFTISCRLAGRPTRHLPCLVNTTTSKRPVSGHVSRHTGVNADTGSLALRDGDARVGRAQVNTDSWTYNIVNIAWEKSDVLYVYLKLLHVPRN